MRGSLVLLFILTTTLSAQDIDSLLQNKRIYRSVRLSEGLEPRIDGLLNDEAWSLGEWQANFSQQQPRSGLPGTETTEVKVLYDKDFLYVAIRCLDSLPDLIREIYGRRDQLAGDMAGIAIDSYFDRRTAFEFNLSAAGQKMDVKHLDDYEFDYNWDAVWDGATSRDSQGWYAEIRIPFSQLRYKSKEDHIWGMHVWRWIARRFEEDQWQLIPREAPAMVYLFGELHGINNIKDSRQVEVLPYILGSLNRDAGEEKYDRPGFNMGLDSKIGLSSDLTLDLSVNPDFGQVEADPAVLNLTSFETFYEEKRPFFLEGNDAFDFNLGGDLPYYSRRIGSGPDIGALAGYYNIIDAPSQTNIFGAAKLTGKTQNGLTFGIVNGLTSRVTGTIEEGESDIREVELAPLSNYFATRVKKEYESKDFIFGGIISAVNRFTSDTVLLSAFPVESYSGGLDLIKYWDNKNYFLKINSIASAVNGTEDAILKTQLSHTQRFQRVGADHLEVDSSLTNLTGHGGLIEFGKNGGDLNFSLKGHYRSPGLNFNEIGYLRQADYYGSNATISYSMNEPREYIRNYTISFNHSASWSFGNELIGNSVDASFVAMNNKLWRLGLSYSHKFSSMDTRELRGGPALRVDGISGGSLSVSSNSSKDVFLRTSITLGKYPEFDSFYRRAGLNITWIPFSKLIISTESSVDEQDYHLQYAGVGLSQTGGVQYLVSRINRKSLSVILRAELFLSSTMSVQYYANPYWSVGDYSEFKRVNNPDSRDITKRLAELDQLQAENNNFYSYSFEGERITFFNPDFSFQQFKSNLVFRWEYKTGSTLYFVWASTKFNWQSSYESLGETLKGLRNIDRGHTVMLKFNYWFSL